MASKLSDTRRDRTRGNSAKAATMRRRAQRRDKSARVFMALMFPADLSALEGGRA